MHLEPAQRRLPFPGLVLGGFLLYLALVVVVHLVNRTTDGPDIIICTVRRFTGLPCPTCGSTRAGMSLLRLDPLAAIAHNPLVTLLLIMVTLWLTMRLVFARRLVLGWSDRTRRMVWAGVVIAALANWAWVLHRHGAFS